VTETADIARTKAELDALCDSYAEQITKVQEIFAEITLKIIALPEKHGFEGMKLGLELMPRIHRTQREAAAVMNTAAGPVN
jgi:hypothetical protein